MSCFFILALILICCFVFTFICAGPSIEEAQCPECHVGRIKIRVYGSADQFVDCIQACTNVGIIKMKYGVSLAVVLVLSG